MSSFDSSSGNGSAAAAVRRPVLPEPDDAAMVNSEAREERVESLREQYQAGTLDIDPAKLASDLVAKHLKK